MLRSAAPVLAGFFGLIVWPPSAQADTYANARFGYSITYPADFLIPEREADNGDGRIFHARHGAGKLAVWGGYRDEGSERTPEAIARAYQADCGAGKVSYQSVKPRLVAFSCLTSTGQIIYQKTLVNGDVLRSVRFDYPYSDRAAWDAIVKQVSGSLSVRPAAK